MNIKYLIDGLNMKKHILDSVKHYCLLATMLMLTPLSIQAATLDAIDFSSTSGEAAKIKLSFSENVSKPNIFSTDEPARIIMDFTGVSNKLAERTKQINIGVTSSISAIEAGDRTRLVVNLLEKSAYELDTAGSTVTLTVNGGKTAQKAAVKTDLASANIADIDFRRGENGEAKIIIKLDSEVASMDVKEKLGNLVIDLANAQLPEDLDRKLDVIDFGTPVHFIETNSSVSSTSLTVFTDGKPFEHVAYQSSDTIVVELSSVAKGELSDAQTEFGYTGERLSLNFQNIEVRAVLQLLADTNNMNLVTSDTVTGNLTLRLKNVPWDQALDIILKTKGLAMRQSGNVMMIAPAAEIAAREKQELDAQKQLVELEPLYTEIIEISFAKASEVAAILDGDGDAKTTFVSPRGSISIDERTNALLIRDTADHISDMQEVIDQLDRPVRQVLIESRIVIANNDFNEELGVRFGVTGQANSNGLGQATIAGNLDGNRELINAQNGTGDGDNLITQSNALNVDLAAANPAGSLGLALAKFPFGSILQLELSAMEAEGKGEVISSPRVITANQKQATIEQGTEIPYQEASSSGATSVSFKEAVLKLDVTPQITPDERIIMDLIVSKDEVGEVFLGVPSIDKREVQTQVLVENGETVVLGGIYEQSKSNGVEKVPFFGDLPYVGFLFKNTTSEDRQRELLIFVTPKIVKEGLQY
jgi:type IV pilus assembly protein PilQ